MIEIINGGMLSTVQDAGRFGVMKNGFTQSGAMDSHSMKTVNVLCGNDLSAPVIEMTMLGITAKFTDSHIFCLSGGDFSPKLNGKPIENNRPYKAEAGSLLQIGAAKSGMRCYLGVSGGIDVPLVMGSASTNLKIKIGGYEGRKLKTGDIIKIGKCSYVPDMTKTAEKCDYPDHIKVRVVLGPQDDMFTDTDLKFFSKQIYTVTPDLDRMGIRLCGIALRGKNGMDITSDGITFGSIQIARSGMPIILMADHQTTGGYAKIATVISVDLPKLAQARPYDKVMFDIVSIKQAENAAKKEKKYFRKLAER
ncbi:MAG: biotin-dependent carboxyltransferase family protein [Oscillospiraceae bacterium]|nr:biotin-dependent carboxyltransferase family protein [Oscillospiraceae bacterium]